MHNRFKPSTPARTRSYCSMRWSWLPILAFALAWVLTPWRACASELLRYDTVPGKSLVEISGSSTLHDWSAQGSIIHGYVEFWEDHRTAIRTADKSFPLEGADRIKLGFNIPVKSLKSDTHSLSEEIWKDLHYDEHPEISYSFISASYVSTPAPHEYVFQVKGSITVNGVKKPHDLLITVKHPSKNQIFTEAETTVNMTDYKITPPTFMFGIMRSDDKVRVKVKWDLKLRQENP